MANATLVINDSAALIKDIYQTESYFHEDVWKIAKETMINNLRFAYNRLEDVPDVQYSIGDVINLLSSIKVEVKG